MRQWILWRGCRSEILERLAVTEGTGARNHRKSDEGSVRQAELARATPRSNPKSEEAKRRVVWVFGGTYDFGVFLAVTLPFIFCGKREEAERGHE